MGLISFYSPGSAGQLTVGILWSTIFVFVCNSCQPYTTKFANALKAAMDGAVLVTMVLSLTLKCDLDKPGEDMTLVGIGTLMILANVCIPCGVLFYYLPLLLVGEEEDDEGIVSTRILGRRTAPFVPFLIPYRVPHGFTPRS